MYRNLFISMIVFAFLSSCTRDKVEIITSQCTDSITYDQHIQLVLDNNCNASTCHNSGSSNGDFTSYEKVSKYFESGLLYKRTINLKNMPPNNELTEELLDMFNCWVEGAYLEK